MQNQIHRLAITSAVAVAVAAGGCGRAADKPPQAPPESAAEARQESRIATALALNPYLRSDEIAVTVSGGKATLTGRVAEGINKDLAGQIARGVSGIKEVDNRIAVDPTYAPLAPSADRVFAEGIEDATIAAAVKSKLVWSQHIDSPEVSAVGGKVTITGTADSAGASEMASRLALNTRGVFSVDNKLNISAAAPAQATTQMISDDWITAKVKTTYAYSSSIDGSGITVLTLHGVVTLSGRVRSEAERQLAIELARNVRGVNGVVATALVP